MYRSRLCCSNWGTRGSWKRYSEKRYFRLVTYCMYVRLYDIVPPHAVLETTQQDPKPEAQDPDTVPPRLEHSGEVKHVPLSPDVAPHTRLGKVTMENMLRSLCYLKLFSRINLLLKKFLSPCFRTIRPAQPFLMFFC